MPMPALVPLIPLTVPTAGSDEGSAASTIAMVEKAAQAKVEDGEQACDRKTDPR